MMSRRELFGWLRPGGRPASSAAHAPAAHGEPADPAPTHAPLAMPAVVPVQPAAARRLDVAPALPAGLVPRIVDARCLASSTSCSVCVERCPVPGAIEVVHHRPRIIEARCTGCGTCLARCPAPVLAIALVPATAPRAPAPAVSPAVAPAAVATTAPRSPR